MATESTAIVNLLDLVKKKPLEKDASDDLLFGGQVRFDPMAMPAPAHPVMLPQLPQPYARQPVIDEGKTHRVTRVPAASPKKLALPVGAFVVAMVVLSIYLAKGNTKHAAAKTTVVHAPQPTVVTLMPETPPPAPQPAPAVVAAAAVPAASPAQQPTITEIPTEAPAAAPAVQPTVPDVQPTVPTVPTVSDAAAVADETPIAKPAPSKHHHHAVAAKRAKPAKHVAVADDDDEKIAQLAKAAKEKSEKPETAKTESLGGKGALQISSSPARVLWVDGRDTKSMTPQKVTLAPGTHNITLFDKKTHSAKTFQVEIKPNATTRVAKSY